MDQNPSGLTTAQVVQRLGLTRQRIDQLAKQGRIQYVVTPRGRLYTPESVTALLNERKNTRYRRLTRG